MRSPTSASMFRPRCLAKTLFIILWKVALESLVVQENENLTSLLKSTKKPHIPLLTDPEFNLFHTLSVKPEKLIFNVKTAESIAFLIYNRNAPIGFTL